MLAAQRQQRILARARATGTVRTASLAEEFGVAEETIRRDLEKLTAGGELLRTHGGAILTDLTNDLPHLDRSGRQTAEKEAIARTAAGLLQRGDTILLDASSTALAMTGFLPDSFDLTVVTASLPVVESLAKRTDLSLVQLGGTFDPRGLRFSGQLTEEGLHSMHIDRFFFSAKGFDLERGASDADPEQARLKRLMVKHIPWRCALLDHSKFGVRSNYFYARPADIEIVVTDSSVAKCDSADLEKGPFALQIAAVPISRKFSQTGS